MGRRGSLRSRAVSRLVLAAFLLGQAGAWRHRARDAAAEALHDEARAGVCAHAAASTHLCAPAVPADAHPAGCAICAAGVGRVGVPASAEACFDVAPPPIRTAFDRPLRPFIPDVFSVPPRGPPLC